MQIDHKTFDWKVIATLCAVLVSLAALCVSIRGCAIAGESKSIASQSLQLAKQSHLESTAPKISIANLSLTRLNRSVQDIAVLSYQINNAGNLTVNDVHSQIFYDVKDASGKSVDGSLSSGTGDSMQTGGTLVSGDHLDKTFLLYGLPDERGHLVVTFKAISDGVQIVTVRVNSQFTDSEGRRIVSCDEFVYQWITRRFERTGVCLAWDVPNEFRSPKGAGPRTIPMPRDGMRIP